MKTLTTLLATLCLAIAAQGQTIKTLGYNTNGQVVANTGTNVLTFTNDVGFAYITSGFLTVNEDAFFNYIELAQETNSMELRGSGIEFFGNAAATTRTNLGLGATNDVQFENVIANGIFAGTNMVTDLVLDTQNWALYANTNIIADWDTNLFLINVPVQFNNTTNAAATRTNLGLGLPALTNTSNVTTMRALAGSTNTNHPFSGTVSVVGTNNTNTLVFSNGILQEVQ